MSTRWPSLRLWRAGSLAPLVGFYLLLTLLPVLNLAAMSVSDVSWADGRSRWSFVGTEYLARVGDDDVYRAGVRNTAWFAAVSVSIQMLLGFTLALLVSRTTRGATVWRMVFLLPILMPGIVIGAIWKLMYDADFGVINQVLGWFGARARDWTGSPELAVSRSISSRWL